MPLTAKGQKIKSAMTKKYGDEKGEDIFYASANKGTIKGVAKGQKLAKGGATRKTSKSKVTKTKSKSRVNEAGNYTKPALRKRLFEKIKAGSRGGKPGQWSARKAQLLALEYKKAGGGYKN
jgi:Na+/glutamate symporter